MKKPFLSFVILLLVTSSGWSQPTQKDLLTKKWQYIGIEEFGVVHPPDTIHKNDWLGLKEDGTYEWQQAGVTSSGTWKLNEAAKAIAFTDSKTKRSFSYNLKKVNATDLTIEYQTPDLVRTRYRYTAVKE